MTVCYIDIDKARNDAIFAYSLCITCMIVCYIDSDIGLLHKDAVSTYTICIACMTACHIDINTEYNIIVSIPFKKKFLQIQYYL